MLDPATGEVIASVANGTVEDAMACVDAADAAAASWAATSPRERAEILRRAFELMTERADEIAHLISLENGKALPDARGETAYAAEFFRWYAEEAVRAAGSVMTAPSGANRILVLQQPVGIAVLVTPWNFPAAMATRKIGPALAAGCTVILKPASDTPLTALLMAKILADAGVPEGVVSTCCRPAAPARWSRRCCTTRGSASCPSPARPRWAGCCSRRRPTRSSTARWSWAATRRSWSSRTPTWTRPIEGAMIAKMRNAGEACTAANRFYVHADVAEEFSRRLAERMKAMTVGPGTHDDTQVGPLVNEESAAKVDELVRGAVSAGARVVIGGERPDREGFYYSPTVLLDVPRGADILGEEIFGPVAPVLTFTDEDDAIAMANDTEYGLVSYVYTRDLARGLRVCERLDAGMVGLNRGLVSDPAAPFGGTKQSGIGREGGHEGMLDYMESKYVAVSW